MLHCLGGNGGEAEDEYFVECSICYTFSLENSDFSKRSLQAGAIVPDQVCLNPKCSRMYHYCCLMDWFQSLPSSRTSFGSIFGSCPYCLEQMAIKTVN